MIAEVNTIIDDVRKRAAGLSPAENSALLVGLVVALMPATSAENGTKPEAQVDGDRLLTVEEAARKLCCSKDALYRHSDRYRAFTVHDGGRLRFSLKGIERYIARNTGRG